MNHLGNVPTPAHIPPQMMGQGPRLLTTAPPVPVVNAIPPLQIEMAPNTQMQQVMAAMVHGRPVGPHEQKLRSFNVPHESESRFVCRDPHSSPELPVQNPEVKHIRRVSESSLASSGFISSASPGALSASPQKPHQRNDHPMTPQQFSTLPTFPGHSALYSSLTSRPYSPATSDSDNDSESLWRPW